MDEGKYYYEFQVGTKSFYHWGLDDRQARHFLATWLRLFWRQWCAARPKGSMADAIDNAWDDYPEAAIARTWCPYAEIIPCVKATVIERFTLDETGLSEFQRSHGRLRPGLSSLR